MSSAPDLFVSYYPAEMRRAVWTTTAAFTKPTASRKLGIFCKTRTQNSS